MKKSEEYVERPHTIRKFKCVESFISEGRKCIEGNTYIAKVFDDDYVKLIFENGEMNFTPELFDKTMVVWGQSVFKEIA